MAKTAKKVARNELTWNEFLAPMKKEVQKSLEAAEGRRISGQEPKGIQTTVMRNR